MADKSLLNLSFGEVGLADNYRLLPFSLFRSLRTNSFLFNPYGLPVNVLSERYEGDDYVVTCSMSAAELNTYVDGGGLPYLGFVNDFTGSLHDLNYSNIYSSGSFTGGAYVDAPLAYVFSEKGWFWDLSVVKGMIGDFTFTFRLLNVANDYCFKLENPSVLLLNKRIYNSRINYIILDDYYRLNPNRFDMSSYFLQSGKYYIKYYDMALIGGISIQNGFVLEKIGG